MVALNLPTQIEELKIVYEQKYSFFKLDFITTEMMKIALDSPNLHAINLKAENFGLFTDSMDSLLLSIKEFPLQNMQITVKCENLFLRKFFCDVIQASICPDQIALLVCKYIDNGFKVEVELGETMH